jgi:hypothetical protein
MARFATRNFSTSQFLGEPGRDTLWGWRVEGHHLSLNFTTTRHDIAATPSFFGSNPGEVRAGAARWNAHFAPRRRLWRARWFNRWTEEQRAAAILPVAAPDDILNSPGNAISRACRVCRKSR